MAFHDRVEYVTLVQRNMKTELPLVVAECSVNPDETLEISVFSDAEKRDNFVQGRNDFLCALAKKRKVNLSGLWWVVADSWSAQFDSEAGGRDIADALADQGAEYKSTVCDPAVPPDWDTAAIEQTKELAATLTTAGLGCKDLTMQIRDELRVKVRYQDGLPAAYGSCSIGKDGGAGIAAFDSKSIPRDEWITTELRENYCLASEDAIAIPGPDWAVFLVKPDTAVAKALGGEPPVGCSGA
jgi:hypothetical protein